MFRILFVLMVFFLTGCSLQPKQPQMPSVATEAAICQAPVVPESLFAECRPDKPIPKDDYLALSIQERENYLVIYLTNTLGRLKDCNTDKASIRNLLEAQSTLKEEKRE